MALKAIQKPSRDQTIDISNRDLDLVYFEAPLPTITPPSGASGAVQCRLLSECDTTSLSFIVSLSVTSPTPLSTTAL
jgi:hypothetical protein